MDKSKQHAFSKSCKGCKIKKKIKKIPLIYMSLEPLTGNGEYKLANHSILINKIDLVVFELFFFCWNKWMKETGCHFNQGQKSGAESRGWATTSFHYCPMNTGFTSKSGSLAKCQLKGLCTFCRTKTQCPQIYIKLSQFEDNDNRKLPWK